MPVNAQEVIKTQRTDWNRAASGWDKWDAKLNERIGFVNHLLVGFVQLRQGQRVLDLGSGTGYPSLVAAQIVGKEGRVLGLDLAENMVVVAKRRAHEAGFAHLEFRAADVCVLDEKEASFDSVISRFCVMFLPEIPRALEQIVRVLKPSGRFAAAVWSAPEKNPHVTLPMQIMRKFLDLPAPDPEQPGIFHLAKPGKLASMAESAGLQPVADIEIATETAWESADEYFSSLMEIAAPLQTLFAKLSPAQKKEAEAEIKRSVSQFAHGKRIILPSAIRLVAALKPVAN